MPVQHRIDSRGRFYRWGDHGKKYYYNLNSVRSKSIAREKAAKQGRAIKASQMRVYKLVR